MFDLLDSVEVNIENLITHVMEEKLSSLELKLTVLRLLEDARDCINEAGDLLEND